MISKLKCDIATPVVAPEAETHLLIELRQRLEELPAPAGELEAHRDGLIQELLVAPVSAGF